MSSSDSVALTWFARLFIAIGLGLAILGGRSGLDTYSFISESVRAESTVVDWNQGTWQAGRRDDGDILPLYRFDVRYAYRAGTARYESTRYRFADPFTDNSAAVERAAERYPVGAVVPCYVDPADATQAVLDRRLSPFMLSSCCRLPSEDSVFGASAASVWRSSGICFEVSQIILRVSVARLSTRPNRNLRLVAHIPGSSAEGP